MNIFARTYHPDLAEKTSFIDSTPPVFNSNKQGLGVPPEITGSGITTPNLIHLALNKMGFGASEQDVTYIQGLPGATDMDKVLVYIDEQLAPESIDDSATDTMLTQGYQTLNKSRQQLFQEHQHIPGGASIPWETHILPGRETWHAAFLRAVNSKRQLFEMMVDFWHNHFNVYMDGPNVQPNFVHYDRDVIRANALGNVRDLLFEVTRSNCMLNYLGNGINEQFAPNENYARELLELHSISAENYFGHMPWDQVPTDGEGRRVGYVEADVLELARALTGWSYSGASWRDYQYLDDNPVDLNQAPTGEFMFRPDWHDQGMKRVMGVEFFYDGGDPEKDVNDILDMLAEHPATAHFIATKLCRRFIADDPPTNIVTQVADSLHLNWQASDQIAQAMEVLLKSNEFLTTWGQKIKRPFERTVAAMRRLEFNIDFNPTTEPTSWLFWAFYDSGQTPFHWTSPNGYPDTKAHWLGASSTMASWRFIQWISRLEMNDVWLNSILATTLAGIPNANDRTSNNIVSFWFEKACGVTPPANTQTKLAEFMSYDNHNDPVVGNLNAAVDLDDNSWPSYNQDRLIAVVSTILLTTEFNYR